MILRFPKPVSRDVLQTTQTGLSRFFKPASQTNPVSANWRATKQPSRIAPVLYWDNVMLSLDDQIPVLRVES